METAKYMPSGCIDARSTLLSQNRQSTQGFLESTRTHFISNMKIAEQCIIAGEKEINEDPVFLQDANNPSLVNVSVMATDAEEMTRKLELRAKAAPGMKGCLGEPWVRQSDGKPPHATNTPTERFMYDTRVVEDVSFKTFGTVLVGDAGAVPLQVGILPSLKLVVFHEFCGTILAVDANIGQDDTHAHTHALHICTLPPHEAKAAFGNSVRVSVTGWFITVTTILGSVYLFDARRAKSLHETFRPDRSCKHPATALAGVYPPLPDHTAAVMSFHALRTAAVPCAGPIVLGYGDHSKPLTMIVTCPGLATSKYLEASARLLATMDKATENARLTVEQFAFYSVAPHIRAKAQDNAVKSILSSMQQAIKCYSAARDTLARVPLYHNDAIMTELHVDPHNYFWRNPVHCDHWETGYTDPPAKSHSTKTGAGAGAGAGAGTGAGASADGGLAEAHAPSPWKELSYTGTLEAEQPLVNPTPWEEPFTYTKEDGTVVSVAMMAMYCEPLQSIFVVTAEGAFLGIRINGLVSKIATFSTNGLAFMSSNVLYTCRVDLNPRGRPLCGPWLKNDAFDLESNSSHSDYVETADHARSCGDLAFATHKIANPQTVDTCNKVRTYCSAMVSELRKILSTEPGKVKTDAFEALTRSWIARTFDPASSRKTLPRTGPDTATIHPTIAEEMDEENEGDAECTGDHEEFPVDTSVASATGARKRSQRSDYRSGTAVDDECEEGCGQRPRHDGDDGEDEETEAETGTTESHSEALVIVAEPTGLRSALQVTDGYYLAESTDLSKVLYSGKPGISVVCGLSVAESPAKPMPPTMAPVTTVTIASSITHRLVVTQIHQVYANDKVLARPLSDPACGMMYVEDASQIIVQPDDTVDTVYVRMGDAPTITKFTVGVKPNGSLSLTPFMRVNPVPHHFVVHSSVKPFLRHDKVSKETTMLLITNQPNIVSRLQL